MSIILIVYLLLFIYCYFLKYFLVHSLFVFYFLKKNINLKNSINTYTVLYSFEVFFLNIYYYIQR